MDEFNPKAAEGSTAVNCRTGENTLTSLTPLTAAKEPGQIHVESLCSSCRKSYKHGLVFNVAMTVTCIRSGVQWRPWLPGKSLLFGCLVVCFVCLPKPICSSPVSSAFSFSHSGIRMLILCHQYVANTQSITCRAGCCGDGLMAVSGCGGRG